jgi:hypothetical protein
VERRRCVNVTTLTKIIRAAGELVNDRCVDRLAVVTYMNLLQKGVKTCHGVIFRLNELTHLIAVSSTIKYLRGNSDDDVIVAIGTTTTTMARMILGSLRAKGQHHEQGGNEMRIPFRQCASPVRGIPQVRVRE